MPDQKKPQYKAVKGKKGKKKTGGPVKGVLARSNTQSKNGTGGQPSSTPKTPTPTPPQPKPTTPPPQPVPKPVDPNKKPYEELFKIVGPQVVEVRNLVQPELQPKVTGWEKEVTDLATAGDYTKALAAAQKLQTALASAKKFAADRKKPDALFTQANVPSTGLDLTALVKAGDDLTQAVAKIDKLDGADKAIGDASALLPALSTEARKALKAKGTQLESDDGGHSLDRHGPDVTNELLKRRLEKGLAADGVLSPTHTSTKFDDIGEWVATREQGLTSVLAKLNVKISEPHSDPKIKSVTVLFEHGRPIDTGFRAITGSGVDIPKQDPVSKGPVYELNKGKKKWLRDQNQYPISESGKLVKRDTQNRALDANGDIVAPDDRDKPGIVWEGGIKPGWKLDTYRVYTKHEAISGLTRTVTTLSWDATKNKWKVVQHFPSAENWDQKLGKYTDTIPKEGKFS